MFFCSFLLIILFCALTKTELQRAASETNYDKLGFVVTHAAMSKEDGSVYFPRDSKVGVENKGISNADCSKGNASSCINVKMYSLDTYVETFVPKGIHINYLSVDVEGWDFEVLLGGKRGALSRVHYLEFEYNWVCGLCMIETMSF
jgi:FkbM family methyltransferase